MGERTTGLHRAVTIPALYMFIQRSLAGKDAHARVADLVFPDFNGARVLEIGCGPGTWVPYLKGVGEYVGIDRNADHIRSANQALANENVRFVCEDLADFARSGADKAFDFVIGMGILHHMDDATCNDVLATASGSMTAGATYIGVEPVRHKRQHPVARLLKRLDSGMHIRTEEGYRRLLANSFAEVETTVRTDLMRVPYSHCLIAARLGNQ